jgi:hypothetical protein
MAINLFQGTFILQDEKRQYAVFKEAGKIGSRHFLSELRARGIDVCMERKASFLDNIYKPLQKIF